MSANLANNQQVVKTTGKGGKKKRKLLLGLGLLDGEIFYNFLQLQQLLLVLQDCPFLLCCLSQMAGKADLYFCYSFPTGITKTIYFS